MSTDEAYVSLDGITWTYAGIPDEPLGFGDGPARFDDLAPFLETRIPSPLERAMRILAPHLANDPRYQPNGPLPGGRPTHPDGSPYRYHEIVAEGWGHCDYCRTWGRGWTPETPHTCPTEPKAAMS
ncbi:hypothetical protein ABT024_07025 [Streptomyces sp. NPDC002812]|uniref:hypothetical protein n=1 Tax=Streptomyces sp. NPDC002812 TaxID=3154434 RepID=UPI00331932DD